MFLVTQLPATSKFLHLLRLPAKQIRNFQVSVIGAANDVGSTVSMLLRKNPNVTALNLHDNDSKVWGIAREISTLPSGPIVRAYNGDGDLESAIHKSHLILMLCNNMPHVVGDMEDIAYANCPDVDKLCKAISQQNSNAFLGIATDPINIMVPFAYHLLNKYAAAGGSPGYNPFHLFGVTCIDEVRAKNIAADFLKLEHSNINVPVIGGHSSDTIVPLFSNIATSPGTVSSRETYQLTTMVRNYVPNAMEYKDRANDYPLSNAWAIADFTDKILKALSGNKVEVQCYMANPQFGTRFFSAPVTVGPKGLLSAPSHFDMSIDEKQLLDEAIPRLNEDVAFAETMLRNKQFGL